MDCAVSLNMQSQSQAKELVECISLTQQLISCKGWQLVTQVNEEVLNHLECRYSLEDTEKEDLRLERDIFVQMIFEAATLCNRVLQFNHAERYLEVARIVSLTMVDPCGPDIMLCQLQTYCFNANCDEVLALIEKPDVQDYIQSIITHEDQTESNTTRRWGVKTLLVEMSRIAHSERGHGYVLEFLQNIIFTATEPKTDFEIVAMQCERDTLLASSMYMTELVTGEAVSRLFENVISQWKALQWPLEYADVILNVLFRAAVHHYKIAEGQTLTVHTTVETMRDLNRCWPNQQIAIACKLYDLGGLVSNKNNEMAIACGEAGLQILTEHDSTTERSSDEWTMFTGVLHYLCGLSYQKLNEIDKADSHFRKCIPCMEDSVQRSQLMKKYQYLIAGTLTQVYDDLAQLLKLHKGVANQEHLQYRRLSLKYQRQFKPEKVKFAQALVADTLHIIGSVEEAAGNTREAKFLFDEAEEIFAESVDDSTGEVEEYAPFVYGYFLYCRRRYSEAADMLLTAYRNSISSTYCLSFTQPEWHMLTDELKFEVEHAEDKTFMTPVKLMALYFHTMSLVNVDPDHDNLELFLDLFVQETGTCDYESHAELTSATPESCLKCASFSLLGYVHRSLERYDEALEYFQKAYDVSMHKSQAARINVEKLRKELKLSTRTGLTDDVEHLHIS